MVSCWQRLRSAIFINLSYLLVSLAASASMTSMEGALDGDWRGACQTTQGDSITQEMQISGRAWVYVSIGYEMSGCQSPYIQYEEIREANILSGTDVDIKVKSLFYTPLTGGTARALNQIQFCGRSDWKAGGRQEVDGLNCTSVHLPGKGQTLFSRYRFTGTELWMGISSPGHEGLKPETRHVLLQNQALEKIP